MATYWNLLPRDVKNYILTIRDLPETKAKKGLVLEEIITKQHRLYYPTLNKLQQYQQQAEERNPYPEEHHQPILCDYYEASLYLFAASNYSYFLYNRIGSIFELNQSSNYVTVSNFVKRSPCYKRLQECKEIKDIIPTIVGFDNSIDIDSYAYNIGCTNLCYACYNFTLSTSKDIRLYSDEILH